MWMILEMLQGNMYAADRAILTPEDEAVFQQSSTDQ